MLTTPVLAAGLGRVAARMEAEADALNALDGALGDGDLGVTMVRGGREVTAILPGLPPDVGLALAQVAQAFTRISGSSFGTLLATGLMAAAKRTKGRTEVPWSETPDLLAAAGEAMAARGKAALGDKTVLDALDAAARAMAGLDDPAAQRAAAQAAVAASLERMRGQPARIGRARIFGEKTIGMDDPGMVAFARMLDGLGDD